MSTAVQEAVGIKPSAGFLRQMEEITGQPISQCYQCKKCSGGCPVNFAMDLQVNEVIRLIQLGARERLLSSKSPWACAACRTCLGRCPNNIDSSRIMEALKLMATAEKYQVDEKVNAFHNSFLASVKRHGRVHELGMIFSYKLKTKTYTQDMNLGMEMFKKGKIKLFPEKIKRGRDMARIFKKVEGK